MSSPFLSQLAELQRADRTRAKWVIVPSHSLGHTLGERLGLAHERHRDRSLLLKRQFE